MAANNVYKLPTVTNAPAPLPQLFNENETSQMLGISVKTLRDWRYRKIGLGFIKLGSRVVYRLEDINAYLEAHRVEVKEVA